MDDGKVVIVREHWMHSSGVAKDVQHMVLARQVSLTSTMVAVVAKDVAPVMIKHDVDSSPVVVQMNELNLHVAMVKQKQIVQPVNVAMSLVVESYEMSMKYYSVVTSM